MNKKGRVSIGEVVILSISAFLVWKFIGFLTNWGIRELPVKTMKEVVWVPKGTLIAPVATGFVGGGPCGRNAELSYQAFRNLVKENEISGIYPIEDGTMWYCAEKEGARYSATFDVIDGEVLKEKLGKRWFGVFGESYVLPKVVHVALDKESDSTSFYAHISLEKDHETFFAMLFFYILALTVSGITTMAFFSD